MPSMLEPADGDGKVFDAAGEASLNVGPSEELAATFDLNRKALCKAEFLSERLEQRLKKRLRRSVHLAPPVILRRLLSDDELAAVYGYVNEVDACMHDEAAGGVKPKGRTEREVEDEEEGAADAEEEGEENEEEDGPEPGSDAWLAEQMRLTASLNAYADEGGDDDDDEGEECRQAAWVRCSESHRKLFLHHGGPMRDGRWRTFAEACPGVFVKLLKAMHASGLVDSAWRGRDSYCLQRPDLNVRCVEFHSYTAGGGLADPGHIDVGSMITLSVQLSTPESPEHGGRFTTTDACGAVHEHELARGDAIVFCSEQVHNVGTLRSGTRNSLVVELWTDPENRVDRHR